MSMKKTDLEKHMAKKLDGRMKSAPPARRFGQGAAAAKESATSTPRPQSARPVPISIRLPAELVHQLRERAVGHEGGVGALVAEAVRQWLAATGVKAAGPP